MSGRGPDPAATRRRLRWRAQPLRVTLVLALLALLVLGLLASGAAATTQLSGFLQSRTDSGLLDSVKPFSAGDRGTRSPGGGSGDGDGGFSPRSRYYIAFSTPAGALTAVVADPTPGEAGPDLPAPTPAQLASGQPYTVQAADGSRWRAVATVGGPTGVVTVAASLADDHAAIERLTQVLLVIGLAVVALLGGLAYLVVRASLRPLTEVEATAAAIAAGDLDRRVPDRDPGTEVGRLSAALNGMLGQIQGAFAATEASEAAARESEAAARSSEERMRRFVGDASHELRTPLTTIRGFAELYRQGAAADPAAVARLLGRIEGEAARMGLLVEDLLLLARLDSQRPLEQQPVDLLVLASDAVHDASAVARDRPVRLEVLAGPGTPEVVGDEHRLRQVLSNLVTNALTHTPAGTPVTVRVGTVPGPGGQDDPDGGDAVLEVTDAGPGLAPEDAERVFERFYRTDTSRTRASGGTGLGLSIVAALVAAHGGTVEVSSTPGHGATFRVRLPRRPQAAPVAAARQ
ncbi:HAMP domain-containing sensor histidine kinase [Rhodococcus aerolatus]